MKLGTHQKIFIGWAIVISLGIYSFSLSKKYVDAKRYEVMKVRQRMREIDIGEE